MSDKILFLGYNLLIEKINRRNKNPQAHYRTAILELVDSNHTNELYTK